MTHAGLGARRLVASLLPWLAGGMLAAATGCEATAPNTHVLLAQGEQAYDAGRLSTATHRLTAFLSEAPARPTAERARYVRGLAYARLGKRALAYSDLEVAARSDVPDVAWRSHAVLGIMRFEDGDWAGAARDLAQATALMPKVPPMDALLFRLGMCHERLGQWSQSLPPYLEIRDRFPRGRYAELAARRLALRADHFAIQAGVFEARAHADKLARELKAGDLPATVQQQPRGDRTYHVVLVGRYPTYNEARRYLGRVRGYVADAQIWP